MNNQVKKLLYFVFGFILFSFFIFLVNQVTSVYAYFYAINPTLGEIVLWLSVIILGVLLLAPVFLYFKLPQPLKPPKTLDEKAAYIKRLKSRVQKNKIVKEANLDVNKEEEFHKAVQLLDQKADDMINRTAKAVFLTTAVSQNGKLDAFTVFVTQTKMVWDVAHVYYQRPSLRDMIYLYGNVGATVFFASEIEDLDISDQIEPVISSILRRPGQAIPIIGPAANIIMDSLVEGSANAFLTLRVGVITKRYCGAIDIFERKKIRRAAIIEASGMLKDLVIKSSGKVIGIVLKATRKAGMDSYRSGVEAMNKTAESIMKTWSSFTEKLKKEKKE